MEQWKENTSDMDLDDIMREFGSYQPEEPVEEQPPVPEEHANLLSMLPMSSIAIGLARIVREILNRLLNICQDIFLLMLLISYRKSNRHFGKSSRQKELITIATLYGWLIVLYMMNSKYWRTLEHQSLCTVWI